MSDGGYELTLCEIPQYDTAMVQVVLVRWLSYWWLVVAVLCMVVAHGRSATAKDLLFPKEQSNTEVGSIQSPSFDRQEKGIPQSLFIWIQLAKGFEVEWDSFGRKGWYTQDPRLKPIEPGSVFLPETPAIYIVFEVAPLEDPAQFAVQWFQEEPTGQLSLTALGKDVLEVSGHERYGYLELKRPGDRWAVGNYIAKVFITPLGQQPFHAVNQVGILRFTVADSTFLLSPGVRSVK